MKEIKKAMDLINSPISQNQILGFISLIHINKDIFDHEKEFDPYSMTYLFHRTLFTGGDWGKNILDQSRSFCGFSIVFKIIGRWFDSCKHQYIYEISPQIVDEQNNIIEYFDIVREREKESIIYDSIAEISRKIIYIILKTLEIK